MMTAKVVHRVVALTDVEQLVGLVAAGTFRTHARTRLSSLKVEQAERCPVGRIYHVVARVVFHVAIRLCDQAAVGIQW
jgi:hypothetical protein